MTRSVSLVGSTGSIGTQTVQVLQKALELDPTSYELAAIGAHSSVDTLVNQAGALRPKVVALADESRARELAERLPKGIEILVGQDSLAEIAQLADIVVNAVVGFAGLAVTIGALQAGKTLALANKESLVAGAAVVNRVRESYGGTILPVDSEHCAIHQCLRSSSGSGEVGRLILTASGGPFRELTEDELTRVTLDEALNHPTWKMGPKITIDSSTLMNKGLEVIEAHELFGVSYDSIDVVIHPQSIIHSMVEFRDGSLVAQLSNPDMRLPIGYCLGYPQRLSWPYGNMNLAELARLDFELPRRDVFRCLDLAYQAGRTGGSAPAWLNAANEVAVEAFLGGKIAWTDIASLIASTLDAFSEETPRDVGDIINADRTARLIARENLTKLA